MQRFLLPAGSDGPVVGLPAPLFISYSPAGDYAALAYPDAIELYALSRTLTLITRIAAAAPRDAVWSDAALFVASDTTVHAHFIAPPAPPGKQLTQQTNMAALSGSDGLPELSRLPTAASYEVRASVGGCLFWTCVTPNDGMPVCAHAFVLPYVV